MRPVFLILLFLIELTSSLLAHTVRPAYLEVTAISEHSYNVKWKVPIEEKIRLHIMPSFPKNCKRDKNSFYRVEDRNIILSYWTLSCKESLLGKKITIDNLKKDQIDVLFYFNDNGLSYFKKIDFKNNVAKIDERMSSATVMKEYIVLGIKHILLGYDHLLFILGLLFIVLEWKMLIKTITAFTVAHSITLAFSILGYVSVDLKFIEVLIALSIMILAVEIVYAHNGKFGLLTKYPWGVAFFFGLIHGFGFASVLMELGLPQSFLTLALLFFNIGIEIGQLLFIGVLVSLYFILQKLFPKEQLLKGKVFVVYLIGSMAAYWLIERTFT